MVALKAFLMAVGGAIGLGAALVTLRGLWRRARARRRGTEGDQPLPAPGFRPGVVLALVALVLVLAARSFVLIPAGRAGVRVSQLSGTRPGTLHPGLHLVLPLIEEVVVYDVREHVLTTEGEKGEPLRAQTKEGLVVGLVVSVRYRLDPGRLDYVHANLPPVAEVVPPVVASVLRQIVPSYVVREVFAAKREELRERAARLITEKLAGDAVLVKEVMLRDLVLPPEYARGLEGLLLKEQHNESMVYDLQIKEKEVKQAELEAEAAKARRIKEAEAQAAVRVLQAKAEADAMQHTLPLKEKQIEQSRLEAEARKESTLKAAEAAAQAKVIDSKAEVERSNLMAGAEAHRIRTTSLAEAERMKLESDLLRENPLLIQKIVAERLSDKMQIMMVPMDGRNFFANELFKEAALPLVAPSSASTARPEAERKQARR
jgi:regulator of protease activity HflC (stomatin/prohibitin superfamily)